MEETMPEELEKSFRDIFGMLRTRKKFVLKEITKENLRIHGRDLTLFWIKKNLFGTTAGNPWLRRCADSPKTPYPNP